MFGLRLDDSGMSLLSVRANPRDIGQLADGDEFHALVHFADTALFTASGAHIEVGAADMPQGALSDDNKGHDLDSDPLHPTDSRDDASSLNLVKTMTDLPDNRHALRGGASAHADRPIKPNMVAADSVAGDRHSSVGVAAALLAPERSQVALHDPRYAILASQWAAESTDGHPAKPRADEIANPGRTGGTALATGGIELAVNVQPEGSRLQFPMQNRGLDVEFVKENLQATTREARLLVSSPVAGMVADVRRAEVPDIAAKPNVVLPGHTAISGAIVRADTADEMGSGRVAQTVAHAVQHHDMRAPPPQDGRALQRSKSADLIPAKAPALVVQSDLILADRVQDTHTRDAVLSALQGVPEHAASRTQGPVPLQLPHRTAEMLQAQVLAALHRPAPNTVQIQLDPIELGRVRISLQANESGLQVHVVTERPETLDLLRKFSVDLLRDLTQMGYKELTMSFSDQREREKPFNFPADRSENSVTNHLSDGNPIQIARQAEHGGVDIRV